MPIGHIIEAFQPKSQGYYVLWTECYIMTLIWAGRECGSPCATFVDIGGYQRPRTRRTARRRSAAQPCGTRAVWTAEHGKQESKRGVAVRRRRRRADDALCPWDIILCGSPHEFGDGLIVCRFLSIHPWVSGIRLAMVTKKHGISRASVCRLMEEANSDSTLVALSSGEAGLEARLGSSGQALPTAKDQHAKRSKRSN